MDRTAPGMEERVGAGRRERLGSDGRVGALYMGEIVSLIDPLLPSDGREDFLAWLDQLVGPPDR